MRMRDGYAVLRPPYDTGRSRAEVIEAIVRDCSHCPFMDAGHVEDDGKEYTFVVEDWLIPLPKEMTQVLKGSEDQPYAHRPHHEPGE